MGLKGNGGKILIVDDSEMNRAILSEMIGDKYNFIEAENGAEAVAVLQHRNAEISLVLLDIVMPVMNGYDVLEIMNSRRWIDDIPVIMISEESTPSNIERAYDMGAVDFIARPFDKSIVLRRVVNTFMLYEKQKKLAELAVSQIYEKEKNSSLMISILSHIVEFRNGESGLHVIHVQNLTEILLKTLVRITDKYKLSSAEITMISHASALHDIGKITIPDEILNKPGRLTDEEFAVMKTHSMAGADMLSQLTFFADEPLLKTAYEICRWHHERFDGRGYPDGISGDDIPISAQIVALADVYDALTSDRVYKKAFTHETAIDMIRDGKCGNFNPLLLECLSAAADSIKNIVNSSVQYILHDYIDDIPGEFFSRSELTPAKRIFDLLSHEKTVNKFFMNLSKDFLFEYTVTPSVLILTPAGARMLGTEQIIVNPFSDNSTLRPVFCEELHRQLSEKVRESSPKNPEFEFECDTVIDGQPRHIRLICRSTWINDDPPVYIGVIGKMIFDPEPTPRKE